MMTAAAALHAGKTEDAHANGRAFSTSPPCTTRRLQHRKGDFSSTCPPSAFYSANLSHSRQLIPDQFSSAHATCCRLSTQGAPAWNRLVVPSARSRARKTLRASRLLARNGMRCSFSSSPSRSSFPHGGARLPITDIDHEPYRNQPNSGWRPIPSPTSLRSLGCCGHHSILQHSFLTIRRSCLGRQQQLKSQPCSSTSSRPPTSTRSMKPS